MSSGYYIVKYFRVRHSFTGTMSLYHEIGFGNMLTLRQQSLCCLSKVAYNSKALITIQGFLQY